LIITQILSILAASFCLNISLLSEASLQVFLFNFMVSLDVSLEIAL